MIPLWLFLGFLETGSAAVVIQLQHQVVLATDSKSIWTHGDGTVREGEPVCKVIKRGEVVVVSTGLKTEPALDFEVTRLLEQAATSTGILSEKMSHLDGLMIPELQRVMMRVKTIAPEVYQRDFQVEKLDKRSLVDVAFISVSGNAPLVAVRSYVLTSEGRVHPEPFSDPGGRLWLLGENDRMLLWAHYMRAKHGNKWIEDDPVAAARSLIEIAIKFAPKTVGPPVQLVKVADGRVDWGNSDCESK